MNWPLISEIAEAVKSGSSSAVEQVEKSLKAIDENEEYNAIINISQHAMEHARQIDEDIKRGKGAGRLAGVPFIAKDNYLTRGVETTAASNILKGFVPPFNATAIEKLEQEGAILVAKANLDSFAHGSSTENSDFGPTLNPHDKTRVPGGSSGGSGAAVALGLAPFALGSDTGGSIRLPASFTGTVGYKPTYGLVSRYGVVAMASSTDVMGPITASVADSALVLDVMSGRDPLDATTIMRDKAAYTDLKPELNGKRIGIIKEFMGEGVDSEVADAIRHAATVMQENGASVNEVSIENIDKALAVYYIVMPAEVSSNLSRYDGIKYGYSSPDASNLEETYKLTRAQGFNDEVKRRIMIGTYVLSSGYYDAYYKKAQMVRTVLINEFNKAYQKYDLLIGPTSPTTAFKLGENTDDPLKMYLSDVMTVASNLTGEPAISIPAGTDSSGLPIGLQIMAPQRHDRQLLAAAKELEELLR